jgi:hypothetical protein
MERVVPSPQDISCVEMMRMEREEGEEDRCVGDQEVTKAVYV